MKLKLILIISILSQSLPAQNADSLRQEMLKSIDTLILLYSNLPLAGDEVIDGGRLFETLLEFDETSNQLIFREYYYYKSIKRPVESINVFELHLDDIDHNLIDIQVHNNESLSLHFYSKNGDSRYYNNERISLRSKGGIFSFQEFYLGYYSKNWMEHIIKIGEMLYKVLLQYQAGNFARNYSQEKKVFHQIFQEEEDIPIIFFQPKRKKDLPNEIINWNKNPEVCFYKNAESKQESAKLFWEDLKTTFIKNEVYLELPNEINFYINGYGEIAKVGRIEGKTNHKLNVKKIIQNMSGWRTFGTEPAQTFYEVKLIFRE